MPGRRLRDLLSAGQREGDPPPDEQSLAFRAALVVAKHPVVVATLLVLAIVGPLLSIVVLNQSRLRGQDRAIQESRTVVAQAGCDKMNRIIDSANAHTHYIEGLIVNGAKSSRIFEPLFRQVGAPPYAKRVRTAKRQARKLDSFLLRHIDCVAYVGAITHPRDAKEAAGIINEVRPK